MHLDIHGDGERLIQASLSSGLFQTAEEAVTAMARAYLSKPSALPVLPLRLDVHTLAAQQGIRPFDPSAPAPNFWPSDESADEFLHFLNDTRQADTRPE